MSSAHWRPCLALLLLLSGCSSGPDVEVAPGVALELARERASRISELRTSIRLSIPADAGRPITGAAIFRFRLSTAERPLVIDFKQPPGSVKSVRVGDAAASFAVSNGHIVIGAENLAAGGNEIAIEFAAGDAPLNRRPDYLYSLFVPDRASEAVPCFDQPDLKTRWRLELEVPAEWEAVSNGPTLSSEPSGRRRLFRFAETRPLSSYLFAFAAGRFQIEEAEREGRRLRMFHRETDAARLERNRDAIFDLHAAALGWLEKYTGIEYPFQKFDFVLVPAFQYGGMEHPGAILYRARSLLLGPTPTQSQLLERASLIAHETAHMWFGDLVTMKWFDDVWTKEVFANFMAAKIVNPSFPDIDHDLRFLLSHYPAAYAVDRTAGTHPIRQQLANLDEASELYGAIIYQKAPVVMRHLERLAGEEAFQEGMRRYLDAFAYGNATWPELISILDGLSPEDLRAWSSRWVEDPGRPRLAGRIRRRSNGRASGIEVYHVDRRGGSWTQKVELWIRAGSREERIPLRVGELPGEVLVPEEFGSLDCVVLNGGGYGYGRFELDPASRAYLMKQLPRIGDDIVQAAAWLSLWEEMLEGKVEARELLDLAREMISGERSELFTQRLLGWAGTLYWRFLSPEQREAAAAGWEAFLWQKMRRAPSSSLKSSFFGAFRSLVLTPEGVERLRSVWEEKTRIEGVEFDENDFTAMARELALRGVEDDEEIVGRQLERISNPERKARLEFTRSALSRDPARRDRFFAGLKSYSNRRREPWVLSGLSALHHPLRADSSLQYIRPSLELLEEIKATGDIFFPKRWLDATFSGHRSRQAAEVVKAFLAERPDYPVRLRQKIEQSADLLFRAAAIAP